MIQIEYLALILTGLGIIVSILYYASVLRNANKTQQIQLETRQAQFMSQISNELNSVENRMIYFELSAMEWTDWADFENKYGIRIEDTVVFMDDEFISVN